MPAVAWCAGFGRLGGVGGPLLGGFLVAAGLALNSIFYVLAGVALLGTILTLLVPTRRSHDLHSTPIEPSVAAAEPGRGRRPSAVNPTASTTRVGATMYDRMLVAIDASPDSPDDSLNRTTQFAKMTGGTVHLLHVARGHIVPADISAGSGLGVLRRRGRRRRSRERQVVQNAVDQLAAAGIEVHGELIKATEHDVADVIVQRAKELDVDIIVLGYQHYRGSVVAEHVIRQQPHCSILLARPPEAHRHRA